MDVLIYFTSMTAEVILIANLNSLLTTIQQHNYKFSNSFETEYHKDEIYNRSLPGGSRIFAVLPLFLHDTLHKLHASISPEHLHSEVIFH